MNLHNRYYIDLRNSDTSIGKLYDKYYELHRLKHLSKAVWKQQFVKRIWWLWRSVWRAVQSPKRPKKMKKHVCKNNESLKKYWREYEGDKVSYSHLRKRVEGWMSKEEAIKKHIRKNLCKRHYHEWEKCLLSTYYSRTFRWIPHDIAIQPWSLRSHKNR